MDDSGPQLNPDVGTSDTVGDVNVDEVSIKLEQGVGIDILGPVQDIIFIKPDVEISNAEVLYELTTLDDQRLFYAFRKSPSKFQPQCDIFIRDSEGNDCLRLMNPKKNPWKVFVRSGKITIGSVRQTNWWFSSPKFILLDSSKHEIAKIRPQIDGFCWLPACCICGIGITAFEVIKRKNSEGKRLSKELAIGRIAKDLVDRDRKTLAGTIGIAFLDNSLDVNTKCLFIAAAIFIDFSVFSGGKTPWKMLLFLTALLIMILLAFVIVFAVS